MLLWAGSPAGLVDRVCVGRGRNGLERDLLPISHAAPAGRFACGAWDGFLLWNYGERSRRRMDEAYPVSFRVIRLVTLDSYRERRNHANLCTLRLALVAPIIDADSFCQFGIGVAV